MTEISRLRLEAFLHPQDICLGHGALDLPAAGQFGQHLGDVLADLVLIRRIGDRDHPIVGMDLEIRLKRAFIQGQAQFSLR